MPGLFRDKMGRTVEVLERDQLPLKSVREYVRDGLAVGQSRQFVASRLAVAQGVITEATTSAISEHTATVAKHAGLFGAWVIETIDGETSAYKSTVALVNGELLSLAGLAFVLSPTTQKLQVPPGDAVNGVVWNPSLSPEEEGLDLPPQQLKCTAALRYLAGQIRIPEAPLRRL